jgi:hypothetical protein
MKKMFINTEIRNENSYYLKNELGSVRYDEPTILDNLLFASPYRKGPEIRSLSIPDDPNSAKSLVSEAYLSTSDIYLNTMRKGIPIN